MSNRVFQGVVSQMKEVVGRTAGVIDEYGVVTACTNASRVDEKFDGFSDDFFAVPHEQFVRYGYTFHLFASGTQNDHAVFVEGEDMQAEHDAALMAIALKNVLQYHDKKYDKANFIKNIVLENILPGDIYSRARDLHFATDVTRVVLLVRVVSSTEVSAYDVVSGLFPDKQKDFVFNVSETDTALVKEVGRGIDEKDIANLAASIIDTLNSEHYIKAVAGIGNPVPSIKDLAGSFKEAQIALEVGKVFDSEQSIISYNHLGIARLIYQLPTTLCEMFLKEVFNQGSIDSLDEETLFTIQRFFENNLNVSETSRGLFVHRNTLVYRLEKIKKLTGLDLREFDDAIVFKVALMVKKYLSSNPAKY
ncbi:MAG: PucR family transcriptional regulator [Oscillospiraceae bacterium]